MDVISFNSTLALIAGAICKLYFDDNHLLTLFQDPLREIVNTSF